jgi:hypothetical protein
MGGHNPGTVDYSVGIETTCPLSRVDNTYVSTNSYLRKSDGLWIDPVSVFEVKQFAPATLKWCSQPLTFRMRQNSSAPDVCS